MILVTLGTQKQQFKRILDYIESSNINEEIIVQSGHTKYESKKMKILSFIDYEQMNKYVDAADLIITHAGTGSIIGPLKKGKKVIACPRKKKFGEHVDDHQEQIVDVLSDEGYILRLDEDVDLNELIKKAKNFKPKKFVSNTKVFIENLEKEIDKDNARSTNNLIFAMAFLLIIFFTPAIIFLRKPKIISVTENRSLTQFKLPSVNSVKDNSYQDELEAAFSDQMIFGATLKKGSNYLKNINKKIANKLIFDENEIIPVERGICRYGDYLIYCPKTIDIYYEQLLKNIQTINNIAKNNSNVIFKVFRIRTDDDIFINEEIDNIINQNLNVDYSSFSKINNYQDYKKYFFKSDHHWNYLGSYEGYKEIMTFLDEEIIMIPNQEICFSNTSFKGTRATQTGLNDVTDEFCVHSFSYPQFKIEIAGNEKQYGHIDEYMAGQYPKGSYYNHYGKFYGQSYGEIILTNKESNNSKNILLLVDSMSNPINRLIASSFNKTFVVDLRRYEAYKKEVFDLNTYLIENEIHEVLIVGNIRNIGGIEFIPKLNK